MPPKPDLVFHTAPIAVETAHSAFTVHLSPAKPAQDISHATRPMEPIIKDWVFDLEGVENLIKDYNFHAKPKTQPIPRNSAHRSYDKQYASSTKKYSQKHIVPAAVLTTSKPVSITATRPVNAAVPKIMTSNSSPKVTAAQAQVVSAAKGKKGKWQNCMSISTAESEYVAVSGCCAKVLWMRTQLTYYGFFYDKVPIYCDSKSAIAISCNLERMQATHDRQKSYADLKRKPMEFQVGDKVEPFKVLERIGDVAYKLNLPEELSRVHNTFHMSNLKKCHADEPLAVPLDGLHFDDKLHFVEDPVEIVNREVKRLKQSRIPLVKVLWNSKRGPEFTWEREDQFRKKYPHLFARTASTDALHLDDAEGVDCLPNEDIFTTLARMGYEKPSTKLTFYKAFFSSQWKFLIHMILQSTSAKRTSWNEFSSAMASAVICLSTAREPENQADAEEQGDAEEQSNDDNAAEEPVTAVDDVEDQTIQSPTPLTPPPQKPLNIPSTSQVQSPPPQQQSPPLAQPQGVDFPMSLLQEALDSWRMIDESDKDEGVELMNEKEEKETEEKLLLLLVKVSAAAVVQADVPAALVNAAVVVTTVAPVKSKDKRKGIMVEEPKPIKKKQQVELDEAYAIKLQEELNQDIDWEVAMDHVKQKAKENPYVQRYQVMKKRPQTEAQA
nr:putative reverse transcriptase domain-containing protein [Tanacetum cinerariifolium]